jgi:hypothetical protein
MVVNLHSKKNSDSKITEFKFRDSTAVNCYYKGI